MVSSIKKKIKRRGKSALLVPSQSRRIARYRNNHWSASSINQSSTSTSSHYKAVDFSRQKKILTSFRFALAKRRKPNIESRHNQVCDESFQRDEAQRYDIKRRGKRSRQRFIDYLEEGSDSSNDIYWDVYDMRPKDHNSKDAETNVQPTDHNDNYSETNVQPTDHYSNYSETNVQPTDESEMTNVPPKRGFNEAMD